MKQFFALVTFLSLLGFTGDSTTVEFGHRRIDKEISKTFGLKNYQIDEIKSLRQEAMNGEVLGKYFTVSASGKFYGYMYVGRVFTCPQGGCDETINSSQTSEYFDYLLLLNTSSSIQKMAIFNYQATHGQEVCASGWLKQFTGATINSNLKPGKNIDTISGATRSVSSLVSDVSKRVKAVAEQK
jgi:hypothetical protein